MKHIICYSGGHSSALVAIEVTRKYGKENIILLNHDINSRYEKHDIKRFKDEVAKYLGLEITYANHLGEKNPDEIKNQFEVCEAAKTFVNVYNRQILCTYNLKTEPFYNFLKNLKEPATCYYGFDENEPSRIERRKNVLSEIEMRVEFPLALWTEQGVKNYNEYLKEQLFKTFKKVNKDLDYKNFLKSGEIEKAIGLGFINFEIYNPENQRTISNTEEIGIPRPNVYSSYKHANCTGFLKAGQQHWYVVYVNDKEIFDRAKQAEESIGHSFGKVWLKDVESKFEEMKKIGIPASEHIDSGKFWKSAKKYINQSTQDLFPCECFI